MSNERVAVDARPVRCKKWLLFAVSIAAAFANLGVAQPLFAESPSANYSEGPLGEGSLRADEHLQQQARAMARQLIESSLDAQLRQFKQNGLQDLDVCQDIDSMRRDVGDLTDADMPAVIALLIKAQQAGPSERGSLFKQAKEKIRAILSRLIVQRQKLARRLLVAQLAAQVRSLINRQNAVRTTTESLSDATHGRQADLALATIQSQKDVSMLLGQLLAALADAESWGSDIATRAGAGLRILRSHQARALVDAADKNLESADFSEAANSQRKLVDSLNEVLKELESPRGMASQTKREILDAIHDLQQRQAAIRQQTQQTALQGSQLDKLVDRQAAVQKDLAKLDAALEQVPGEKSDLAQAKAVTEQATADLFNSKRSAAIDAQSKALANLDRIEHAVEQASQKSSAARSAAEFADQLRQLQSATDHVGQARSQEKQAVGNRDRAQSAGADNQASEILASASQLPQLSADLKSLLQEAAAAGRSAADADRNGDISQRASSEQSAQQSLDRADAAIARSVNETKLAEKAVSAGELARAAEALERVTSAERQVAKETNEAARSNGLTRNQAQRLTLDQLAVKKVAEVLAKELKDRSPNASAPLVAAGSSINAAGHDLVAAQRMPGEATKQADDDAARQATAATDKLRDAASQLRGAVADEAGKLAQIADEQAKPIAELRQQMQAQLQALPERGGKQDLAQRLASIDAAAGSEMRRAADRLSMQKASDSAESSLAARQEQLENVKSLAEQIGESAKQQEQARNEIVAAAAKLSAAVAEGRSQVPARGGQKTPTASEASALQALDEAEQSFAEAQTQIGDNSEQVSGQTNIANQPIRAALEAASQLGRQPSGESPGQPSANRSPNGTASQESQTAGIERQMAQAMGADLLPSTPQVTAKQIAGSDVSSEMLNFAQQRAMAQSSTSAGNSGQTPGKSKSQQQANGASPEIATASAASEGGAGIKSGQRSTNLDLRPNELSQSPLPTHSNDSRTATNLSDRSDGRTAESASRQPSWFAALPPEARNAIRAKAHEPRQRHTETD